MTSAESSGENFSNLIKEEESEITSRFNSGIVATTKPVYNAT